MIWIMILTSYASGPTNGKWSLILTPPNKQLKYYFLAKKVSPSHPQLSFNGTVIKKVNEQKHLGLILDSGFSFKKHLDEKIIIAKNNIGIIKHLSKFLPLKTLDQIYKALARPHLDYCDNPSHSAINQSASSTSDL